MSAGLTLPQDVLVIVGKKNSTVSSTKIYTLPFGIVLVYKDWPETNTIAPTHILTVGIKNPQTKLISCWTYATRVKAAREPRLITK